MKPAATGCVCKASSASGWGDCQVAGANLEDADGGAILNRFDAFGNKTETWVQTGSTGEAIQYSATRYQFDLQGQLKATVRPEAYIRIVGGDANGYLNRGAVARTIISSTVT